MKRKSLVPTKTFRALAMLAYLMGVCGHAMAQQPTAATAPITSAQYGGAMAQVQADCMAVAASQGGVGLAKKAIADIAPLMHPAVLVRSSGAAQPELVYVDNRPLAGQMQAANLAQATSDATAEEARAARWLTVATEIKQIRATLPDADSQAASPGVDAHASAIEVLNGSDFASEPIPPESIWERMGDAIQRWLNKLHFPHSRIAPATGVSPIVPEIILIVVAVAAIGLIVYFTVVWLLNRAAQTSRQQRASQLDLAFTAEEKELVAAHNYARLRVLADEAAQAGDFRSGYRLVFLAILVYLDSEGAIRLNRSKTNWEYLRSLPVGGDGGLRDILRPVVREFDRIWYGESAASQREFDLAAGAYAAAQAAIEAQREPSESGRLTGITATGVGAARR